MASNAYPFSIIFPIYLVWIFPFLKQRGQVICHSPRCKALTCDRQEMVDRKGIVEAGTKAIGEFSRHIEADQRSDLLEGCCPICLDTCKDLDNNVERENGEFWTPQSEPCRKCQCKVTISNTKIWQEVIDLVSYYTFLITFECQLNSKIESKR